MKVIVPDALRSYTGQAKEVSATGANLDQVFHDLDHQFPGLRFRVIDELGRIRPNIKLFVNHALVQDLSIELGADDEIFIMQALSGG